MRHNIYYYVCELQSYDNTTVKQGSVQGCASFFLHGWGKPSHYYRRARAPTRRIVVAGLAPAIFANEGELCFHTPANMRTSVNLCRGEARLALNNVCLGFFSSTLYYTRGEQIFVAFRLSFFCFCNPCLRKTLLCGIIQTHNVNNWYGEASTRVALFIGLLPIYLSVLDRRR